MNHTTSHKRFAAAVLLGGALAFLSACSWSVYGDHMSKSEAAKIAANGLTRQQVVETYGEPSISYDDISTDAYRWEHVSKIRFHDPSGSSNMIDLSKDQRHLHHDFYLVCIQYDEQGVAVRSGRTEIEPAAGEDPWANVEAEIRAWAAGEAPAPPDTETPAPPDTETPGSVEDDSGPPEIR